MASLPKHKQPSERRAFRLVWLLTAHLVSSYFMFIQAQNVDFQIVTNPPFPLEGQSVKLIPEKPPGETESCLWSRGENDTYLQIVLYFPSNNTFEPQRGYHSGHLPLQDCVLAIENVSYLDMAIYGLLVRLPNQTLFGETFLTVTREREPTEKKGLGAGLIAGISAGCIVGILLVAGLVAYQAKGTPFRRAATSQEASESPAQATSANKEINTTAASQNLDPEGHKM